MKKIKGFVNKNYKIVIGIIIGITISVGIGVSAVATKDIIYDNSTSGLTSTNLQGAIDELNTKATTKINEAKNECPEGKVCVDGTNVSTMNSNIVVSYTYNQASGADNYCVTGEEETCVKNLCYFSNSINSCKPGTIIKYKVNDSTTKYFHVLHDDGTTMTLQQRETTVRNKAWYYNDGNTVDNTQGPKTILPDLESATTGWTNVNDQTYTMGTTNFNNTNSYTGCDDGLNCTTNTYTLGQRTAKARMITVQEAVALGCTTSKKSCPIWMYNYLNGSTSNGGTVDDGYHPSAPDNHGYWTMSTTSTKEIEDNSNKIYTIAWFVSSYGLLQKGSYPAYGARAVVVVNK